MRAVRVAAFGGPEVCKVEKVPLPRPGPGQERLEIVVNVKAAGVNPIDTYIRSGLFAVKPPLPYTPGKDGAGYVHAIPPGLSSRFQVSDRVYFTAGGLGAGGSGAYAEYAAVPETLVWPLPESLSFHQGAALGVPYHTAYRALFQKCRVKPGETVLIHGASGGVGVAAVQIGKAAGVRVLGTAGTPEGIQLIKDQGADAAFNHRDPGYLDQIRAEANSEGVDVVLEMLANVNLNHDLGLLRQNGRIAVIGSRGTVEVDPRLSMMKESSIHGVALLAATPEEWVESGAWIDEAIRAGKLAPVIGSRYPLEDAPLAHHDIINSPGTKGKMILCMDCEFPEHFVSIR